MSDTNGTAQQLSKAQRRLERLCLKQQLAEARIKLARTERQAKAEELKTAHWWPQERNRGSDLLRENLTRKRDHHAALLEAKQSGKDIPEGNFLWDWVSGYQDLIDRLRSPDGLLLSAISIAADKKFGCYWPFFRTWNDLALLRGASRILYQTSALAMGTVEGLKSYIIGQGSQTRAVEKEGCPPGLRTAVQECLDEYSDKNQWPQLEEELLMRDVVDGEWLLREFPQDDGTTLVRTVDAPQLIQPGDSRLEEWSFGIKNPVDPYDVQGRLAYYVCYDGDNSRGEEVPADQVHYHKSNTPRDVKRGLPDLAYDVYDFLKVAGRLIVNMAEGASIQAAVAQIRQWDGPVTSDQASTFVSNDSDYQETNPWTGNQYSVHQVRPGELWEIPKGMTFVPPPFSQGSPIFIQVEQAVLRAVAVRWNAPEWLSSGDASNNNYASSLTAESPFIKRCCRRQEAYEQIFCKTRWNALRNKIEAKGLSVAGRSFTFEELRKYIDLQVELPSPEVRNKAEEAQANSIRVQAGWKSRQTVAQEEGLEWEQEKANIEQYNEEMGQQGNPLGLPPEEGGQPGASPFEGLESFTGIDSHGHKWVNGKQVAKSDGGAGSEPKAAHSEHLAAVSQKVQSAAMEDFQAASKLKGKERLQALRTGYQQRKAEMRQAVQTHVEEMMPKVLERIQDGTGAPAEVLKPLAKGADFAAREMSSFAESELKDAYDNVWRDNLRQPEDLETAAKDVQGLHLTSEGAADAFSTAIEATVERYRDYKSKGVDPEDDAAWEKIFKQGDMLETALRNIIGSTFVPPKRHTSESFTGIDAHGHKWVNGKQVPVSSDHTGSPDHGSTASAEAKQMTADLADKLPENLDRVLYLTDPDDDGPDLREADPGALQKLGLKVLAVSPSGAHVVQIEGDADPRETAKLVGKKLDMGARPLLKAEPWALWDASTAPAETLYGFDGKYEAKPLNDHWYLLGFEGGDQPRVVPAAKIERLRKQSARYAPRE